MRRLIRPDTCPPGEFRFTHPETGHVSKANNIYGWRKAIKEHRRANNLPMTADIMDIAEDKLCDQIPPSWCEHTEQPGWLTRRFDMNDLKNGMKAFVSLMTGGFNFVPQEEADRRSYICAGCKYNMRVDGCAACGTMAELIVGDVAKRKTPYDSELKSCAVCHCACSVMVHFPMDAIETTDSPERQAQFPNWCWRKRDGVAYKSV